MRQKFILLLAFLMQGLGCYVHAQVSQSLPTLDQVGAVQMPAEIAPIHAPFDMPNLQRNTFPNLTVSISEKGAKENSLITDLINYLIEEVSQKGGGTVLVPRGHWKSGRIVLKSNVNLHLEAGAELEFSDNPKDYLPAVFTRHEGIEIMGSGAFIYANGEDNIAVTGKGKILGPPMDVALRKESNTTAFMENDMMDMPLVQRIYDGQAGRKFFAPKSIAPINCTNVLIEGVTLERCLFWNINPTYCENLIIRGVTIHSKGIPSGDGIDISSCKNTLIEYCTLDCGDDCYTLKSGRGDDGVRIGRPTENVVIRYALAKDGHGGITCGSETAANIKNVYGHDCVFIGTRTALRFKTRRTRGGGAESVFYERMQMINVGEAFTWDLLGTEQFMGELARRYPAYAVDKLTPIVKNIHIKDFKVESASRFFTLNGIPEAPLRGVTVENGDVQTKVLVNAMNDVDGFVMKNLRIRSEGSTFKVLDGRNIQLKDVIFNSPSPEITIDAAGEYPGRGKQ